MRIVLIVSKVPGSSAWSAALRLGSGGLAALALVACASAPGAVQPPATPPSLPQANPTAAASSPQRPAVLPARAVLALGGGAARGFAHIGVLQVLEEQRVQVEAIVGTSAGSLVAALAATGAPGHHLQRLAREMDEATITDWTFPLRGLIRGEALASYVRTQTGGKTIEQLAKPLGIVATELASGEGVMFRRGDVGQAVRASSSVPAVFQPVRIAGKEYVDGGLVSPVPVRYAQQLCSEVGITRAQCFVIAVDISSTPSNAAPADAVSMLLQTFAIMSQSINRLELREADLVVRPQMAHIKSADFNARMEAIAAGREAALRALAGMPGLLKARLGLKH